MLQILKRRLKALLTLSAFLCLLVCSFTYRIINTGRFLDKISFPSVELEKCPVVSPYLIGRTVSNSLPILAHNRVLLGGKNKPSECLARHRVAVIVPYRDRQLHLKVFLNHIHPFLQRQQLDYSIFVVEQSKLSSFNRGMLMNIEFLEARQSALDETECPFDCYLFHDVDLLPEDDRNSYGCPNDGFAHQLVSLINIYNYTYGDENKIGPNYFGGASCMTTADFMRINGFSNAYWGWGAEDDDLYRRAVIRHNITIKHANPLSLARYTMIKHVKAVPNPVRFKMLHQSKHRMDWDGLSSLTYHKVHLERKPLYTQILVEIKPLW